MGSSLGAGGANLVKHKSHAARKRRDFWLRAGIWAFIILFAFSIVGGALIAVGTLK